MKKFLSLIILLTIASISAHAGGDVPQPLGSDVIWYKDTLGTSPFKTKFIGMWFSPDGKTIAVPQGKQLFLVSSETGDVTEKIDVGFYIKGYCAANDRFLLANDTSIFIYDKYTYKQIKRIEPPQNLISQYNQINVLSPDGKTIITGYTIDVIVSGQPLTITEVGIINVEGGNYKKIKDVAVFKGIFSPDGKYFIAYEADSYSNNEKLRVIIYDSMFTKILYDTKNWVNGNASNFSFSADSKLLYFSNVNTMYSVDLANGFKVESIVIPGNILDRIIGINDTLNYIYYSSLNSLPILGLMNIKTNAIRYVYTTSFWGGQAYIAPNKSSLVVMYFDEFIHLKIPYDKLTKTEEEITQINNGFTLSPNPFVNQANFNIFLIKDQDLNYTIYTLDGKEVKREYIGKYGAGYANGTLYLADMTPGTYLIVFSGADGKLASGKINLVN